MSSIRTLLLTAPTLADLLHLHAHLMQADTAKVGAKTLRRWDESAYYRVAEFIREAATPAEVAEILNCTKSDAQYSAPPEWKDGLIILARERLKQIDPHGNHLL